MRFRMLEQWETELREELREVIEEKVRERGILWKFYEDSKALDDGVNQIANTLRRLDQHASRPEHPMEDLTQGEEED